jgi:hypothetical protein
MNCCFVAHVVPSLTQHIRTPNMFPDTSQQCWQGALSQPHVGTLPTCPTARALHACSWRPAAQACFCRTTADPRLHQHAAGFKALAYTAQGVVLPCCAMLCCAATPIPCRNAGPAGGGVVPLCCAMLCCADTLVPWRNAGPAGGGGSALSWPSARARNPAAAARCALLQTAYCCCHCCRHAGPVDGCDCPCTSAIRKCCLWFIPGQ